MIELRICGIIQPVSERSELTGCNTQNLSEIESETKIELRSLWYNVL